MATVHGPSIDAASATKDREGWREVSCLYKVQGVAGSGLAVMTNALNASGIPRMGQTLAGFEGLVCTEQAPDAQGGGVVNVRCRFERIGYEDATVDEGPGQARIRVGSSLQQVTTSKDVDGGQIAVQWPDKPDQGGTVTVGRPHTVIHVLRREYGSPLVNSKAYVGKTNLPNQFRLGGPCAVNTWRCNSISGDSSDGGRTYDVEYEFEYAPEGWDQTVEYTDSETGKLPDGWSGLNAAEKAGASHAVPCYHLTSFNHLRF